MTNEGEDLSCSCSQCNGVQRRRAPTAPIVNVLRGVAARIAGAVGDDPRTGRRTDAAGIIVWRASLRSAGELPRKQPSTLPEAFLW